MKPIPYEAISKVLAEVMDIAVSNGANSVSMPDEYVEIAAWLADVEKTLNRISGERAVESKLDAHFEGQGRKYLVGQRVILNDNEIGIITGRSGSDKFSVRSLTSKIIRDFVSISDIKPLPGGQL